MRNHTNIIIA